MEAILQWGLDVVRLAQVLESPGMTFFMRAVSALGSGVAYVAIIGFAHWCVDRDRSLRLSVVLLVSLWLNTALKLLLDQPRPFDLDPSVGLVRAALGGLPSGHAQNSLVVWFVLASWGKSARAFVPAAVFCLLTGLSRVYLGVHFPTDVLGGWLVGAVLLCAHFLAGDKIEAFLRERAPRVPLVALSAVSLAMIASGPSVDVAVPAGLLLGMGVGFYLCGRGVGFSASSPLGREGMAKFLVMSGRFAVGIAGLVLLFALTEKLSAGFGASPNFRLFIFVRYAALALWITLGAPAVFRILHLGENDVIRYEEQK